MKIINRNSLKLIACLSMLIDHIGYLFFPGVLIFRYIGRLAFPLFAFFIGEGCRYTRNRKKYFLQVFLLGVGCQLVYIADDLIEGGRLSLMSDGLFLNILLTFSLAIGGCYTLLNAKEDRKKIYLPVLYYAAALGLMSVLYILRRDGLTSLEFDYGISGLILPASVCLAKNKKQKLILFSAALIIYCFLFTEKLEYTWFCLAVIPLLIIYNEKAGTGRFKYAFYIFYPAHLGLLYLIKILTNV